MPSLLENAQGDDLASELPSSDARTTISPSDDIFGETRDGAKARVQELQDLLVGFLPEFREEASTRIRLLFHRLSNGEEVLNFATESAADLINRYQNSLGFLNSALEDVERNGNLRPVEYSNAKDFIKSGEPKFVDICDNASRIFAVFIDRERASEINSLSAEERWALVDKFSADFPGLPVSHYVRKLFPELENAGVSAGGHAPLPSHPPALWATDKHAGETPPDFIKRHYEPWIGRGLARPDIKRLDARLYVALNNWLRHNEIPSDLNLPTLKEKNDGWVATILKEGRPTADNMTAKEASRLAGALHRRTTETRK